MAADILFMIVGSDPLARAGLNGKIEALPGCKVVGSVNPSEILSDMAIGIDESGATVIIWDWGLENSDSESVDFREADIPVILLLADHSHSDEIWATGAKAIIKRDASSAQLYASAIAVCQGMIVIDPELATNILPPRSQQLDDLQELPTKREQQVLQLMAKGKTNKAIARELGISQHTVKFHVNAIFGKLNAQSRTEAVVQATRLGLIAL